MTTFDASTAGSPAYGGGIAADEGGYQPSIPAPPPPDPFDAFESLREQLADRDEEFERTTTVDIPGLGWRLVCAIDFEYPQYKDWQKASLPKSQRNGRRMNPLDMDQAVLSRMVLMNTCEGVQFQRGDGGEWDTLLEPDGQPATLTTPSLLNKLNIMDPNTLVRKLFGTDARLIAAGTRVITKAGFGEPEGADAEDPTE